MPTEGRSNQRKREPARDRILDAAAELFYAHGVNSVGIDAVIERAGVAKMSLYNHFASKDELVAATLERIDDEWFDWLEMTVDRLARRPEDRPLAFFDALYEWFGSPGFRGCPFLNVQAEVADASHPARGSCRTHTERLREFIRSQLRLAGAASADERVEDLLMLTEGAVTLAVATGDREAANRAKRIAQQILS
jgi:AcrR family transcriptional regulator